MTIYQLLLGHLLGDFVLQTDAIAGNKSKYWQWNALHAFLVTLCIFVLAVPFGTVTLLLVLLNGVVHFFIDYFKPYIVKRFKLSELTGFLGDQLLHMLLLYLISLTAVPDPDSFMLQDPQTVKVLLVIVLVTSFAAVLNQFILGAVFPRADSRLFERGEKQAGIVIRLFAVIIIFFSMFTSLYILFLLPLAAAILVPVFRRAWSSWMSMGQLVFKLLLDLAVSMAGICLIFWF